MEISFYVKQCEIEGWSVRVLKRQMQSMLFHRLALSKDKEQVLKLSHEGQQVQKPEDILRDPYVFDFVGLPETYNYTEKYLEDGLFWKQMPTDSPFNMQWKAFRTNFLQRNTNSTCQVGKNCKISWIGLSLNKRKMTINEELNIIVSS